MSRSPWLNGVVAYVGDADGVGDLPIVIAEAGLTTCPLVWPSGIGASCHDSAMLQYRPGTFLTCSTFRLRVDHMFSPMAAPRAIVFNDGNWTPLEMAYLLRLTGATHCAGISREFGGEVLSDPVPPPPNGGPGRHRYLVASLGLVPPTGAEIDDQKSAICFEGRA